MFFSGLTNDAVLIRLQCSGYGAGLNAFQFVPVFPTQPTATTPTYSPSTVYALVPVTITETATGDPFHTNLWYQWFSDNASRRRRDQRGFERDQCHAHRHADKQRLRLTTFNTSSWSPTFSAHPPARRSRSRSIPPRPPDHCPGHTPSAGYDIYSGLGVTYFASFTGAQPISLNWQYSPDGIHLHQHSRRDKQFVGYPERAIE